MTKTAKFTDSVDPDEVAHNELPHEDLHCLSSSVSVLNMVQLDDNYRNFCGSKFCCLLFGA